jgi:hypothetical protein
MKKSVIMVLALTALFGCSKMEQEVGVDVNGNPVGGVPVQLTGVIEGTASTRGDGVVDAIPVAGLELSLYRADANASNTYSGYVTAGINGTLQSSGAIGFDSGYEQTWDGDGNKSSFIAVYPRPTTYSSGTTLTVPLDGSTDLMSSELAEGSKTAATISLKLKHLLVKAEVEVIASSAFQLSQTENTWGDEVTSIDLLTQENSVTLTLPTPVATPSGLTVSPVFSGSATFALTKSDGDPAPVWTMSQTGATFGYVMFAPGTSKTLTFKVKTAKKPSGVDVTVTAKTYVVGKRYKLTFTFTPTGGGTGIGVSVLESSSDSGLFNWEDPSGGPDNTPVGL